MRVCVGVDVTSGGVWENGVEGVRKRKKGP